MPWVWLVAAGHLGHHACRLGPQAHRQPGRIPPHGAAVLLVVDRVRARRPNADQHLARTRRADRRLDHRQRLGPAERRRHHRAAGSTSACPTGPWTGPSSCSMSSGTRGSTNVTSCSRAALSRLADLFSTPAEQRPLQDFLLAPRIRSDRKLQLSRTGRGSPSRSRTLASGRARSAVPPGRLIGRSGPASPRCCAPGPASAASRGPGRRRGRRAARTPVPGAAGRPPGSG